MDKILGLDSKQYTCVINYKDNDNLRNGFNTLTRKIYGFDFEQWYKNGYWKEQYIPYSLLCGDKIVANVSVNLIDFLVFGEIKHYVQIGTVMTDETHRGKGLSRFLMERVLSDFEDKCDLIYLFANDSVLDFYPKFGFYPINEYVCSKPSIKKEESATFRKLNMLDERDINLLIQEVSNTMPFSKVVMTHNVSLVMFYCTFFMKDSVYYISDYDTVAIADFDGDTLYLHDIFSTTDISIDRVINVLMNEQTTKVVLGFTPFDISSYNINLLKEDDTTLFVKNKNPFEINKLRFPVLSHT